MGGLLDSSCGVDREGSYPIYEYEGVGFEGDLPVHDYRAALDVVKPQLAEGERVTTMSTSSCLRPSKVSTYPLPR